MSFATKNNRTLSFIAVTAGSFLALTLTLVVTGLYPEPTKDIPNADASVEVASATSTITPKLVEDVLPVRTATPTRITIASVGIDAPITSPYSADIDVLDRALQSGAVRYPGSGLLEETANMLIFGHSSYLPVVRNRAYQAFNELGKVSVGDRIIVHSAEGKYEYTVDRVRMEKADDVLVEFTAVRPTLTLATCNTFGTKEDRWVVTASLTKTY